MVKSICLIGAGRIGRIHANNLASISDIELRYVVDHHEPSAQLLASKFNCKVSSIEEALLDPSLDGVIIASATDTHLQFILASAKAKKSIFCEKPLDLNFASANECASIVEESGVKFLLGFNRRFDPNFVELKKRIDDGEIGTVESVHIISRDPSPPSMDYIKVSGGIFRDMTIHDFDMARWFLQEEVSSLCVFSSCLVDKKIGLNGDSDSAIINIRTDSGKLCSITNSRRAAYGYDQRIEVHGSLGMISAGNVFKHTVHSLRSKYATGPILEDFFLERYEKAYKLEMEHFADILKGKVNPCVTITDGLKALYIAEQAQISSVNGQVIHLK